MADPEALVPPPQPWKSFSQEVIVSSDWALGWQTLEQIWMEAQSGPDEAQPTHRPVRGKEIII